MVSRKSVNWKKRIWTNSVLGKIKLKKKTLGILFRSEENFLFGKNWSFKNQIKKIKSSTVIKGAVFQGIKSLGKPVSPLGSILILLSEKYKGKKVILLKTTSSGLYVVAGPFLVNGVSLRRVNPRYTIPTGAIIKLDGLNLSVLNDLYFETLSKSKKINKLKRGKNLILSHRLRQFYIDKFLISRIKKNFFLNAYLKTRIIFSSLF
mmetsp:Transcript_8281/g.16530  ORF Transcript_8281/g.16530 Transcript_8281/m.16530 type:complete len:206 (+) Transcript_8281:18-635(+)